MFHQKETGRIGRVALQYDGRRLAFVAQDQCRGETSCPTANKMWGKVSGHSKIIGITNAIHVPTWVDQRMIKAAESGAPLWDLHQENKKKLFSFVEKRTGVKLNPEALTLGFSRRAVPYKRSDFIFRNKEKADRLFSEG